MDEAGQRALQQAVGGDWKVAYYATEVDFIWLWSGENAADGRQSWIRAPGEEKNLLIVWDGMPTNLDVPPINITDQLTPFDWLVSFSHSLLELSPPPPLRVLILDCHSFARRHAFGCRMADSLVAALPWLGVVRLMPAGDGRSAADQWDAATLKSIIKSPCDRLTTLKDDEVSSKTTIDSFVQAWVGNLSRSTSHHEVNNLLGPLVLLEGFGWVPASDLPGRSALTQHARWLGIAPAKVDAGATGAWFDAQSLAEELDRTIRIVLVDDQANNGWTDVIAAAIGLPKGSKIQDATSDKISLLAQDGKVELWASTSPDPVIAKLNEALPSGGKDDRRFALQLTEHSAAIAPVEILLLDLRLAADKSTEVRHFNAILNITDKLHTRNTDHNWPWPWLPLPRELSSLANEYERAEDITVARGSNTYLNLLALSPRVVATADLSLPLIVFSSTGQRTVTENFKGYGNIITAFEKPRFAGYRSDDMFLDVRSGLTAAFEQAADLLRGRTAVQNICRHSAVSNLGLVDQSSYVEIFLDESGTPGELGFTVAGLILFYPNKETAGVVDERLCQTTIDLDGKQVSLRWSGNTDCIPKRLSDNTGDRINKIDSIIFPAVAEAFKSLNIRAVPFALRAWQGADVSSGVNLLSGRHLDNLFLHTAKHALDAVLFELIPPSLRKEGTETINIYAATRLRVLETDLNDIEKKRLFERFGILVEKIEVKNGFRTEIKSGFRSVRPDSFSSIVADILRNRPNSERPGIGAVVGVPINIGEGKVSPETTLDTLLAPAKDIAWYLADKGVAEVIEPVIARVDGRRSIWRNDKFTGTGVYDPYKRKTFGYADGVTHLRQAHFLADLLAHTAFKARQHSTPEWYVANGHFKDGMLDDLGESGFEFVIDASKCLEAHDFPAALLRATVAMKDYINWKGKFPHYEHESIVPRVLAKIGGSLAQLSGEEFCVYCRSLRDWLKVPESELKSLPQRTSVGQVRSWEDLPPPWKYCDLLEAGDLTVTGFAQGVTPQDAKKLVQAYLTKVGIWTEQILMVETISNKRNAKCKLSGISPQFITQIKQLTSRG